MTAISVVIAVRDGGAYLEPAVRSVLGQTERELEVVVVDDGSTDGTREVLDRLAAADPRLRVLDAGGVGQAAALALGVTASRGALVARMDADDLCEPGRLAHQRAFLDANPAIGLLGTACRTIDGQGVAGEIRSMPTAPLDVRWRSLLANPFLHPTVVVRRALLEQESYDPAVPAAQDYDLWARLLRLTDGANLPEPLVSYRIHGAQTTATRRGTQLAEHDRVARTRLRDELDGMDVPPETVSAMRSLLHGGPGPDVPVASVVEAYLEILDAFARRVADRGDRSRLVRVETRRLLVAVARARPRREALRAAPRLLLRDPAAPVWLARRALPGGGGRDR